MGAVGGNRGQSLIFGVIYEHVQVVLQLQRALVTWQYSVFMTVPEPLLPFLELACGQLLEPARLKRRHLHAEHRVAKFPLVTNLLTLGCTIARSGVRVGLVAGRVRMDDAVRQIVRIESPLRLRRNTNKPTI